MLNRYETRVKSSAACVFNGHGNEQTKLWKAAAMSAFHDN